MQKGTNGRLQVTWSFFSAFLAHRIEAKEGQSWGQIGIMSDELKQQQQQQQHQQQQQQQK